MAAAVFAALSFSQVLEGSGATRLLGAAGVVVGLALHVTAIWLLHRRRRRGGSP
ncbi:MAG: hypothetical protein M3N16_06790 [Actinomycetota bacterium]|nr:hypothetical protein [Actinomycetota bacterium]